MEEDIGLNKAQQHNKQLPNPQVVDSLAALDSILPLEKTTGDVVIHSTPRPQEMEKSEASTAVVADPFARFTPRRKGVVVIILSYCSFLTSVSSTAVLAASPEVASEFNTTGSVINLSNSMFMLMMAVSPLLWGPLSSVVGRRPVTIVTVLLFWACSIATALAPNIASFFIFRILTAFEGTSFILVGSAVVGDMYHPREKATALSWFLSGTLIGPALGPLLSGIIVTYTSWRVIFWLQTALAGFGAIATIAVVPETIHRRRLEGDMVRLDSKTARFRAVMRQLNPWNVIILYRNPGILFCGIASGSLLWNLYSIFAAIRYVLNPRFELTTPLQSGLFYIAPGAGYIVGTLFGGRFADWTAAKFVGRRDGLRIPADRLYSALPFMMLIVICMLVYGWTLQFDRGGIPLAVIILFVQGVAQLFCFPSLNTFCLEVMPSRSGEMMAANFVIRYIFACIATACVLPSINAIGIGWFSTMTAALVALGLAGMVLTIFLAPKHLK